jgi:hypothetical protein
MAKLTKHAEVLNQLHTMVKKQAAEAQKNITGVPGGDVKSVSVSDEHETTNKNSVGPENVVQGYHQKATQDASEPLATAKTANDLGTEILDIIRKQAEAQDSATGAVGQVKSESVGDDKEKTDKNAVKPENNKQHYGQKGSTDGSKPLASAKKAEVEDLAAKVASYDLGRQFCAALIKSASENQYQDEYELVKEAGRRDFDLLIAQAADSLEDNQNEKLAYEEGIEAFDEIMLQKQAEEDAHVAGANYFDSLVKQAALEETLSENEQLSAKLAEYENFFASAEQQRASQEQQVKLAETVAGIVLNKLKEEIAAPAAE